MTLNMITYMYLMMEQFVAPFRGFSLAGMRLWVTSSLLVEWRKTDCHCVLVALDGLVMACKLVLHC